jgi:monoamine oxidase
LEEAGIRYHETSGDLYNAQESEIHKQNDFIEHQKLFAKKLSEVNEDMSVQTFLDLHFKGERYDSLRRSIEGYVQGYDLADIDKASTLFLKQEWLSEDDAPQYRIEGGYGGMINYLVGDCERHHCSFEFNTAIKRIDWKPGMAKLFSSDGKSFECRKVVITVPLGIWQSQKTDAAHIEYHPGLTEKLEAAKHMGYGEVIKFIIQFSDIIWENEEIVGRKRMKNLGFVFANTPIPTWWTQAPQRVAILTGWCGGPPVRKYKKLNNEGLLQLATDSLSQIFGIDHSIILEKMVTWRIYNWAMDEFSMGGYAFPSLNRRHYIDILSQPVGNTIFVAGEALWWGNEVGMVEGALRSALHAAEQLLQSYNEPARK